MGIRNVYSNDGSDGSDSSSSESCSTHKIHENLTAVDQVDESQTVCPSGYYITGGHY